MRSVLVFLILLVALVFLAALATSPKPEIERPATPGLADLDRGRLIVRSLDLKHLKEGQERHLRFDQKDLALALNWLIGARGAAEVGIDCKQLDVRVSLHLDKLPRFLNLYVSLRPQGDLLEPAFLRVGKVPLPAALTNALLLGLLEWSPAADQVRVARSMLRRAELQPGVLALTLVWRGGELRKAIRASGWEPSGVDSTTLDLYRERLAQVTGKDYATLLGAAFGLAQERGGDPVAENRVALTSLAEVALGSRLYGGEGRPVRAGGARLAGREDSSQHFSLSALIAVAGGENVSELVGVYKELSDVGNGSGFSFNDLAADKAGARLGELATRSPATARRVQAKLAGSHDAGLFYPAAADLPEFMHQAEFTRRYGGVGQPAYNAMVKTIETRIAALPLYRE
jgi:hypothetical protein